MSKRQATCLFSTEAEYIAASIATQEAIYLTSLLQDLCHPVQQGITIFQDNQDAIEMEKTPTSHHRTEHIDIRYHFIRERVQSGEIIFKYLPTSEMAADGLTKPVSRRIMDHHKATLFGIFSKATREGEC